MQKSNSFLSTTDIDMIFEKVLTYLSDRGVTVQHAGVLKALSAAGAHVDHQTEQVRFPKTPWPNWIGL